jgi:3-hydroxyisobutyrate dehydrogenase
LNVEPIRRIAFVGLGNMGAPMAGNLVAGGFELHVHDARADALASFIAHHPAARSAVSVPEVVQGVDAVVTMLPDDAAVRSVMLGDQGIVGSLPAGGVAIDMGTSSPSSTVQIAAELERHGLHYVDAPVMGGVPFARDGTLDVMVGGSPEVVERCMPVFAALGRKTHRCGPVGSGHALKAIANFVNAATFVTLIEAMSIGRKFGLETPFMVDALTAMCAGRQYPLEKKIVPQVLNRRFATGMAMGLIAKDLGIAAGLGRDVGARNSIAEHTQALWREAVDRYGFARDQAEIARLWEDDSGVEL